MEKDVIKIPYNRNGKTVYEKTKGYRVLTEKGNLIFIHKDKGLVGENWWRVSDYKTGYLLCFKDDEYDFFHTRQGVIDWFVNNREDEYMQLIQHEKYQNLIVNKEKG